MDQVRVPLIDTSSFSTPHSIQTSQDCAFFLLCCWDFYMCHVMVARPSHHLANSSIFVILTFWMSVDLRKEVSQKKGPFLVGWPWKPKSHRDPEKDISPLSKEKEWADYRAGSGKIPGSKSIKEKPFYRTCQGALWWEWARKGNWSSGCVPVGQACGTHLSQACQETSPWCQSL